MTRPLRLITRQAEQRRLIDVDTFIVSASIYACSEYDMLANIHKSVYGDFVQTTNSRAQKINGNTQPRPQR